MASKFRLRTIFRPLITNLAKLLIKIGVSPNLATSIMLLLSIFSMICLLLFSNLILFSLIVFLVGIFDGLDGAIARLSGRKTAFGAFFDSIMDRGSEFFIFFFPISLLSKPGPMEYNKITNNHYNFIFCVYYDKLC